MLTWSNLAKFQKMLREAHRPEVPRELGPTVTVPEAAALLGRSQNYVRARIAEGRLNAWQHPISRRYHIILDDVHLLTPTEPQPSTLNPQPSTPDEDDDIRPFSHDTYGAAGVLEDAERESERRHQARLAQLDAELAALRAELGLTEEDTRQGTGDKRQETSAEPTVAQPARPAEPNHLSPVPCLLSRPFPIGWLGAKTAAAMLGVTTARLNQLAATSAIARRRSPTGRPVWLYDSVELEQLANARLDAQRPPEPGKSLRWWGTRTAEPRLGDFDYLITRREAAQLLGITEQQVSKLCNRGMLPCRQAEPGKRGSRLLLQHAQVVALRDRPEYERKRAADANSRHRPAAEEPGWEVEFRSAGIPAYVARDPGPATRRDHGQFYTTR